MSNRSRHSLTVQQLAGHCPVGTSPITYPPVQLSGASSRGQHRIQLAKGCALDIPLCSAVQREQNSRYDPHKRLMLKLAQ
jgi:hypothetical protein